MLIFLSIILQLCITPYVFGGDDVIIDMSAYPIVRNATAKDLVELAGYCTDERLYHKTDMHYDATDMHTVYKHLQEKTSHFLYLWKTTAQKPLVLEQHGAIQAILLYKLIEQPSWYGYPNYFWVESAHCFSTKNNQQHVMSLLKQLTNNQKKFPVQCPAALIRRYNMELHSVSNGPLNELYV